MGVSGSGKSTVGQALAGALRVPFADADEFHPAENIAKMSAGTPLTDGDRWPWLDGIGRWLAQRRESGAVATCSALKRSYRDALRAHAPDVWFLHLDVDRAVIAERVAHRSHHLMPASLLDSQLDALEVPEPDEIAVVVDAAAPPDDIVAKSIDAMTA